MKVEEVKGRVKGHSIVTIIRGLKGKDGYDHQRLSSVAIIRGLN